MHRKALGRGLEALIPSSPISLAPPIELPAKPGEIPVEKITANPHQPRTRFDDDAIQELAASIKATGVLQPVIVRRIPGSEDFQLVVGERRLRAAIMAGLK